MPELLAAEANGELFRANQAVRDHVGHCSVCGILEARMEQAQDAFRQASGWELPVQPGAS